MYVEKFMEAHVRFVWNRKRNNKVELEIYSSNTSRKFISTGITIQPEEWDPDMRQAVGKRAKVINAHLSGLQKEMEEAVRLSDTQDAAAILELYKRRRAVKETDFLSWLSERIDESPDRPSTRKHKITMLESLKRFGKIRRFQDLTPSNIAGYDIWLQKDDPWLKRPPRGHKAVKRSRSGLHNYHKSLKPYIALAYRLQLIDINPYDHFKDEKGKEGEVVSLTHAELVRLIGLDLSGNEFLCKARDLFVFQAFTGLAYVDAMDFSQRKIVVADDGRKFISGKRVKTDAKYYTPLLPEAEAVLEKYGHVPYIDNGSYNARLKVIAVMAGIGKRVTSHVARHTFITLSLEAGAAPNVVQRMAGHTSLSMTERYTHLSDEYIEKGSEMLFR